LKVGVIVGAVTVTDIVVVVAHCPALGVNVYDVVPTVVVLTAGDHVPVILFVDTVDNTGGVEFTHTDWTGSKVGVIDGAVTVTVAVVVAAH
jgi:hypothetical protein